MIPTSPTTGCTRMQDLPKEALEKVAAYFQALSEPTRLSLLNLLRGGERNVGELAAIVRLARKYELLSLGANASLALSLLSTGDECAIHASAAADFYRDHGVRNPAAWARIDFPSFAALLRGFPAAG